jgi:hypothetical protein
MRKAEGFHFEGFAAPTTTQVPDEFFDELAPQLTEAELRVALYVIRRTFGFKKTSDDISLKQLVEGIRTRDGRVLDRGAGLSKSAAARGVKGLVEKGVVAAIRNRSAEKGDEPTTYVLRFKRAEGSPPVFSKETRGSPPKEHPRVLKEDTQQTVEQQTARQVSKLRRQPALNRSALDGPPAGANGHTQHPIPPRHPPVSHQVPESQPASNSDAVNGSAAAAAIPARRPLRARLGPEERRRYDEDRRRIVDYLSDFARELGDAAPLASSVTRAVNIQRAAGVDFDAFAEALYHARAVTKERWAAIREETRKPGASWSTKRAMPYFFAELERVLGLRDLPETPEEHAARKAAEAEERDRAQQAGRGDARAGPAREWVQTYEPRRRSGSDGA